MSSAPSTQTQNQPALLGKWTVIVAIVGIVITAAFNIIRETGLFASRGAHLDVATWAFRFSLPDGIKISSTDGPPNEQAFDILRRAQKYIVVSIRNTGSRPVKECEIILPTYDCVYNIEYPGNYLEV